MPTAHLLKKPAIAAILAAAILHSAPSLRADPTPVTISGATLFDSFFAAPGSTNDFIDINSDGIKAFNSSGSSSDPNNPFVQNIAPVIGASNIAPNGTVTYPSGFINGVSNTPFLAVSYRGVGSVNGLIELLSSQSGALQLTSLAGSNARLNGFNVVNGGASTGAWASGAGLFPAGAPITAVDIATSDVTSKYATQGAPGVAAWNNRPTLAGYGTNSVTSSSGYTNKLASLTVNNTTYNYNTATPDAHTLYDTTIATVPINIVANPGVGSDKIKSTDLQQLYVTGRLTTGENLMTVTRSIGSGTRNAAMNSLGVDPSFGIGDNIGSEKSAADGVTVLGASFQPTNMNGSGDLEAVMVNARLGIGYDGSDRAKSKPGNKWGSMQVMFDHLGGTQYVTPDHTSIVNNTNVNTGWRIYGAETMITVGDPNATNWAGSTEGTFTITTNPAMANADAALYIRNITASIKDYTDFSGTDPNNQFMPSQQLASNFVLRSATSLVQSSLDPTSYIANPDFVQGVHDKALTSTGFDAPLVSDAAIGAGFVPTRTNLTSGTYTDGQTLNYRYYDNSADTANAATGLRTISSANALNLRNKVAGDFNNDGARNILDATELVNAANNATLWAQTHNSGQSAAGLANAAIPEILGDFNGDGNLDSKDVRYFADGLALRTSAGIDNTATGLNGGFNDTGHAVGNLDRRAGFVAIDHQFSLINGNPNNHNYFGTLIATGKTYREGDSRGDVAGFGGGITAPTAGAAPTGADGIINGKDIDYVWAQAKASMGAGTSGSFATLLTRAASDPTINVRADLSADINGDLNIDIHDVDELVRNVMGTQYGDANLDRVVDIADMVVVANNWNQHNVGWSHGDVNNDGIIDIADMVVIANNWNFNGLNLLPGGPPDIGALLAAQGVPEPTSLALLSFGTLALIRRNRKRA